ncbi:hypothetical protein TU94_27085 [Streptomyces cyaneogriseus subsp. noncyanogenus]|uniref:Uncharacterized protein n=1 Tax=Streptomyces cyaneogriseus subsp. noncyanogenus TaxID=477245 RepID=A0A0C5G7A2_9ACTN|nr:hypothetical protein [Streptomyces cyaneogriseus]AJP04575.1 hypothetical protein TU94_27085 [Streptomyces cyaneogriseus subsp. noncyanogenus]
MGGHAVAEGKGGEEDAQRSDCSGDEQQDQPGLWQGEGGEDFERRDYVDKCDDDSDRSVHDSRREVGRQVALRADRGKGNGCDDAADHRDGEKPCGARDGLAGAWALGRIREHDDDRGDCPDVGMCGSS